MRCKRGSPGLQTTIQELLWLTQDLAVEHLEIILTFFLHGGFLKDTSKQCAGSTCTARKVGHQSPSAVGSDKPYSPGSKYSGVSSVPEFDCDAAAI